MWMTSATAWMKRAAIHSCVGGFALSTLLAIRRRRKAGLPAEAMSVWAVKVISLGVLIFVATYLLNQERQLPSAKVTIQGVPWVVVVILVLLVGLSFILQRTGFGRHVYAVGGNREAARRAGINVKGLMITCFIFCSTLAAVAGVLLASRDNSVSPTTGGAQTLLFAVGAAVIGGTSLAGGVGTITGTLLGVLLIGVINNGLDLQGVSSYYQAVIKGVIIVGAVWLDRRQARS